MFFFVFFWLTILSIVIVSRMLCLLIRIVGNDGGAVVASARNVQVTGALRLVHAAPDIILSLVGKIPSAVVARLITTIACADVVALLLAPIADVRQNNRVDVALGTPAVSGRWGVAWVVALREALVAIVGPENGGPCVATVRASHGP